jgi:hypothetical protein
MVVSESTCTGAASLCLNVCRFWAERAALTAIAATIISRFITLLFIT